MVSRVVFVVGVFPAVSETFITNQIAGLLERGVKVHIFSFRRGDAALAAAEYTAWNMGSLVTYVDFPTRWVRRVHVASRAALSLLRHNPKALFRALHFFRYGANAWSLKLLCWAGAFANLEGDIVHCHFGPIADNFRVLRAILDLRQPWLTTFYGYDVSQIPQQKGRSIYHDLARECPRFLVMSEDMKLRVVALGFDAKKITVHPVGITTQSYPFHERSDHTDPVRLVSVARLVEKKGIDDLVHALAEARSRTVRAFTCTVVGDGPLRASLQDLAHQYGVNDILMWTGALKQEEMLHAMTQGDIYVQPSKTSSTGDRE